MVSTTFADRSHPFATQALNKVRRTGCSISTVWNFVSKTTSSSFVISKASWLPVRYSSTLTKDGSARLTPFSRRVVIWFGSGSSVFLRYPLGVYAATCRSWIGMKAKLGCRGMPHAYYPHGTNSTPKRVQQSSMVTRRVHQSSSRDQCHLHRRDFVSHLSFSGSPL